MGVLKGYFDDSGTEADPQHRACTIAGYIGTVDSWSTLENQWSEVLRRYDVPYLHMRDFAHSNPPFKKWKNNNEQERATFLKELIVCIAEEKLYGVGATVRIADLQRFNSERGHNVGAYELSVFCCLLELSFKYPDTIIELVLDRIPKHHTKLATVEAYAETDQYYPHCHKNIQMIPLTQGLSYKTVPGIQVADFVAWELRKSNENMNEWFESRKSGNDPREWFNSLLSWTLETKGRFPAERRSCSALLEAAPIEGIVLDYRALCEADDARGHVWPS